MSDDVSTRPFYEHLGLRIVAGAPAGESCVELTSRRELENSRGDVHGGAIAGLLDAALSIAARSALPPGHGVATVSLTVNYAGTGRGTLTARGRTLRAGRTLATAEASVVDGAGALVAHAIATLRVIAPRS